MKRFIDTLKSPNIGVGYLYFYIHFITEVACFYVLANLTGNSTILWLGPFVYDAIAFVPQALLGYISDKYPKINMGIIGTIFLAIGVFTFANNLLPGEYTEILILCIGNACLHIAGAEATLKTSNGKLSHSAIFVGGGSFGVVTGRILGSLKTPYLFIIFLVLSMIPFILLADSYEKGDCHNFKYHNKKVSPGLVILLAVLIVITRGYMGYGIPTSWNKTLVETIIFYCIMGIGKCLGGILSDMYGVRKIGFISILLSVPFLIIGDQYMLISLFGVLLFSMTMAITLGLLVSVMPDNPGFAFGHTTLGLFLGTVPIFFFKFTSVMSNAILIIVLSVTCLFMMLKVTNRGDDDE